VVRSAKDFLVPGGSDGAGKRIRWKSPDRPGREDRQISYLSLAYCGI